MKYKVGDRVRIKSIDWYNKNKDEDGNIEFSVGAEEYALNFTINSAKSCGNIFTILTIVDSCLYVFKEIDGYWIDEVIEGFAEAKFKVDDIVDTNDNLYGYITDNIKYDEDKKSFKYYVSFLVDGGYYYEYQLKPHKSKDKSDMGEVSDGYHTFNELYEYRLLYNASFFNELAKQNLYNVHKSKKHSNGEDCFGGGWFIVMAELPTGQVSNHYELKDWDLFQVPEKEKANKWDEHTPKDVAERIRKFLTPKSKYPFSYEECYKIIVEHTGSDCNPKGVMGYKYKELQALQKLLVCRDAYWKIADWEPDWENSEFKYCIKVIGNKFECISEMNIKCIFAFPTEEMRDAFYKNFKDLIEQCKELL